MTRYAQDKVMPAIWRQRALRAWLALALPLALLLAYLAVSAHYEASRARDYAQQWYQRDLEQERQGIPKGTFSQDPKVEVRQSYQWMADAEAKRDRYAVYAALLLFLAPAASLGHRVAFWVWGMPKSETTLSARPIPTWISRALFGLAAAAGLALVLALASDRALQILISTLVQVVGISLVAWLLSKLRK
jgi:hypothetical protein